MYWLPYNRALLVLADGGRCFHTGAGSGFGAAFDLRARALFEIFVLLGIIFIDRIGIARTAAFACAGSVYQGTIFIPFAHAVFGPDGIVVGMRGWPCVNGQCDQYRRHGCE